MAVNQSREIISEEAEEIVKVKHVPSFSCHKTQEAFLNLPIYKFITESRPLKSVAQEKWGTHDALWVQWPGNEVAKTHRQLRSPKIWIDKFLNGGCKILLCVCLETMETQLEQLVLFESDEMKWCYDKTELELNMYLCGAGIYNIYLSFSKSK